jgi:hypothetical protein
MVNDAPKFSSIPPAGIYSYSIYSGIAPLLALRAIQAQSSTFIYRPIGCPGQGSAHVGMCLRHAFMLFMPERLAVPANGAACGAGSLLRSSQCEHD